MTGPIAGVGGLVSGINSNEIIDALVEFDRRAVLPLENRKTLLEGRQEAVRTLNLRFLEADTSLFTLRRASTFNARTVSSAESTKASATATSTAVTGDYTVRIDQLAQAHQLASGSVSTGSSLDGTLTIQLGAGEVREYDFSGGKTLSEIAQAINQDAAGGARAQVLNDGGQQRLVLTGRSTGQDQTIVLGGSLTDGGEAFEANALTGLQAAQDAQATLLIGGLSSVATSATNRITGLIEGVTIEAKQAAADANDTVVLSVGTDTAPARQNIVDFVESLNAALEYFNANATYDSTSKSAGILFSEGDIRGAVQRLRSTMGSAASGAGVGDIRTLAGIGISIDQQTGLFSIDEAELDAALDRDGGESVRRVFVEGGLGERLNERIDALSDSFDGVLANKADGLTRNLSDITGRITSLESRFEQRRLRYQTEFLAMEKLIASFRTQETFMAGQIEGFQNLAANSSGRG